MLYEIQCCQCTNINLLLLHCTKVFVFGVETPQGQSVTLLRRIGPGFMRACHLGRRMAAYEMTLPETRGEFFNSHPQKVWQGVPGGKKNIRFFGIHKFLIKNLCMYILVILFIVLFCVCNELINKWICSIRQICRIWRERFASFHIHVYWHTSNMPVLPNHIVFFF